MPTQVFFKATFNPESGLFNFIMQGEGHGKMAMELSPDQFLTMATYLARVGAAYNEWLKNGGSLEDLQ